ncbi:MAG: S46 family peptidase [candidate division Zixibacteria bacterium]|nr:S46 family peptidase [candidate division Zixibacteria bacterium]
MRAYVAPDGSSAEYAEENVPYQSKTFLPVSSAGVTEGDFAMIIGFPGRTSRYASSYYIDDLVNYHYPNWVRIFEDALELIEQAGARDSSVAIRLASMDAGINNGLKNSYGMLEGFTKTGLLQRKIEDEKLLAEFINADTDLMKKYVGVLPALDSLYQEQRKTRDMDFVLGSLGWADYLSMANGIYKWAVEREKDDMERERGYQDRDSVSTREWLEDAQVNLVPSFDKDILKYFIKKAFDLPQGQKIQAIENVFAEKEGAQREAYLDEYIDNLYGGTAIGDLDQRMKMFGMSKNELEELGDPFIDLAVALKPQRDEFIICRKEFSGASTRLEPRLIAAYAEWKGDELYPDANGTMRFNYGSVKSYSPRDAVRYSYLTSLNGVMEKETGEDPFIIPAELKRAYAEQDFGPYEDPAIGDVPVNFLTTNDGTGGNSGSPIINGRGELIGLDFDCNYESVAADYLYNPELARSIVVDIRYVLFVIDKVYHLEALLNELTIH